jgi:hypothetical protein
MTQEDKEKIQKDKEQLLAEQTRVKEVVNKSCHSVPGLAQEEQDSVDIPVANFSKTIQQLQVRISELEIQAVPNTPREERDQRKEAAGNAVGRNIALSSECK